MHLYVGNLQSFNCSGLNLDAMRCFGI